MPEHTCLRDAICRVQTRLWHPNLVDQAIQWFGLLDAFRIRLKSKCTLRSYFGSWWNRGVWHSFQRFSTCGCSWLVVDTFVYLKLRSNHWSECASLWIPTPITQDSHAQVYAEDLRPIWLAATLSASSCCKRLSDFWILWGSALVSVWISVANGRFRFRVHWDLQKRR